MPIYEYRCQACGHDLEKLQRLSDAPLTDCPACGKPALKRLVSAAGFRLKGGGWYETDFKKGNQRNLADGGDNKSGGESKPAGDSKSGGDGKDAKSAPAGDGAGKPALKSGGDKKSSASA